MKASIKDASKLFKLAISNVSEKDVMSALNIVFDGLVTLRIPFELLPSEKTMDIMPYIKEWQLDDAEKMWEFLVELHFACFDSVNDGISGVRNDLLDKVVSKINQAKGKMKFIKKNPDRENEALNDCLHLLEGAFYGFNKIIDRCIIEIDEIDNMPRYMFFVGARTRDKTLKDNAYRSKTAMNGFLESLTLLNLVARKARINIDNYNEEAKAYIKGLSEHGKISLMLAYDPNKKKSIWNSKELNDRINYIQSVADDFQDLLDDSTDAENDEVDLEEIVF